MPSADGTWIDLRFAGRREAIGTGVIGGRGGAALVDPGPSSCVPALEQGLRDAGLRFEDVTDLLLTHIHVDHAGAAGTIVRRWPHIRVVVHDRGAPHIVDPSRLVKSATRLFGDAAMAAYGEMEPVPAVRIRTLAGGEELDVARTRVAVAYTPGHAVHHVSYLDRSTGAAYVGDTAGVSLGGGYVMPPTPPPDLDVAAWHESLEHIARWQPRALFLTHFGRVTDVGRHLQVMHRNLTAVGTLGREVLESTDDAGERVRLFADRVRRELYGPMDPPVAEVYESLMPFDVLWLGLQRYWSKQLATP